MASDDVKEEIRRRLDIVEIVSQYVPLARQGRRFGARCPFHQEKTPSFFVDPERGFWKCFGCGESGDLFSFVMKIEGLTFPEAAERLAQRAGVQWRAGPAAEKTGRERRGVLEANEAAAGWFKHKLFEPEGQVALDYLRGRGLSDEIIRNFGLGYAPGGWDNLLKFMAGKGFNEQLLTLAGLVKPGSSGGHYDVFRHRVMYPIVEVTGRVIGFGGRALDPEEQAKYINSPDTPVFKKGDNVYGLNLARQAISNAKQAIVVEGYMDVIALVQAGFANAVACLGTATTEQHLVLLGRYAESIFFVYDADAAGMRAALRNIAVFETSPASSRLAVLPPGQDPDDCVRTGGPAAFQKCLDEAMSFPEYEIKMAFERFDMGDADGRLRAAREAVGTLLKVTDRARREELLDRVAARWAQGDLGRSEQLARVLLLELNRRIGEQRGRRPFDGAQGRPGRSMRYDHGHIAETLARAAGDVEPGVLRLEEQVLTSALHEYARARALAEVLTEEDFADPRHKLLARALLDMLQEEQFVPADLVERFAEAETVKERAIELLVSDPEWTEEEFTEAIAKMAQVRTTHGLRLKYEVKPHAETEPVAEAEGEEDFEAWRRTVAAAIDSGEIAPDDPDFVKFMRLGRRFQGTGQQGFVEHAGLTSFSAKQAARPDAPQVEPAPVPAERGDTPSAGPDERS